MDVDIDESEIVLKQYIRPYWARKHIFDKEGKLVKIIPGHKPDWPKNCEQTERGPKIGVMVALKDGTWGFSIIGPYTDVNPSIPALRSYKMPDGTEHYIVTEQRLWTAKDKWEFGVKIAYLRAKGLMSEPSLIPPEAEHSIKEFEIKVHRKFKDL
jgi:hypothetical protein